MVGGSSAHLSVHAASTCGSRQADIGTWLAQICDSNSYVNKRQANHAVFGAPALQRLPVIASGTTQADRRKAAIEPDGPMRACKAGAHEPHLGYEQLLELNN